MGWVRHQWAGYAKQSFGEENKHGLQAKQLVEPCNEPGCDG